MTIVEDRQEQLLEEVRSLVESGQTRKALTLLPALHPADQADLIAWLSDEQREPILRALTSEEIAHILEHLSAEPRQQLLQHFVPAQLGPLLDLLPDDVAADAVQQLPDEEARAVLAHMTHRAKVEPLLVHEEDSAGGRMIPDILALRRDWTSDEAIRFLRTQKPDVEQPYYLYVLDAARRLEGVVSLRQLIIADPDTPLAEIMDREVISVDTGTDQEVAAEKMRHYDLLALPVVDEHGRLVGVLSADDVLDVQVEEATEDMYRMAGLAEHESLFRPVRKSAPPRLGWLAVNLATAFLAAATVSLFESTIAQVAALAVFMPVIAGMGGNAGIQTITLVVRSLALGEIDLPDAKQVLRREVVIAAINGVALGIVVGVAAWLWKGNAWLGVVAGIAMLLNIANAVLVGVLVPLGLKALRVDPALASGIVVTTFTDVIGFLIFLGLGALLITRLI
ncbi:MAG: magnesium transporter [Acidobacteriota bacterium]